MTAFLLAIQFLTTVPLRLPSVPSSADYARSTGWYPCVGLLVGVPGAIVAWSLEGHLPSTLVALAVLSLPVVVTGALHLDGFADCCDALFAPRSKEERLGILKDSRIGVFGATGLTLLLLTRFVALAAIP